MFVRLELETGRTQLYTPELWTRLRYCHEQRLLTCLGVIYDLCSSLGSLFYPYLKSVQIHCSVRIHPSRNREKNQRQYSSDVHRKASMLTKRFAPFRQWSDGLKELGNDDYLKTDWPGG